MFRLLFYDATVSVNINNQVTERFGYRRPILQGFPIAPYLVINMVEALNAIVKHKMRR